MPDDAWFYIENNIVGYSGILGKNEKPPTVYFVQRTSDGWIHYGHITQYHIVPRNVGREKVRRCKLYAITNQEWEFDDYDFTPPKRVKRLTLHECVGGEDADIQGRELVKDDAVVNGFKGTGILMGKGFVSIHPSRNPFIPVNAGCLSLLATSITNFPKWKEV